MDEGLFEFACEEARLGGHALFGRLLSNILVRRLRENVVLAVACDLVPSLGVRWRVENLLRINFTEIHALCISKQHTISDLLINRWVVNQSHVGFTSRRLVLSACHA